jgi:hypothetical protein
MEKEKWKDDMFNSLRGIQRAEPNAFLFTRIEARLEKAIGLSPWQVRLAGALMVLLLVINILVVTNSKVEWNNSTALTTIQAY